MSVTSHDYDRTILIQANSTVLAGDLLVATGTKSVCMALTAATSGNNFSAKIEGIVKGVTKTTSTDVWIAGADLTIVSGGTVAATTSSGVRNAIAYAATTSTVSTADVLLVFPARSGL